MKKMQTAWNAKSGSTVKAMWKCAAVTVAAVFMSAAAVSAQIPSEKRPDELIKKLSASFDAWKLAYVGICVPVRPEITKEELETGNLSNHSSPLPKWAGWRILYTKLYDEDALALENEKKEMQKDPRKIPAPRKNRFNHIDIVVVPESKEFDPVKDIQPFIEWKKPENEYAAYILYIGVGQGYWWFARANLSAIEWIRKENRITGGYNRFEILAEALNVEDKDLFTSRTAIAGFANAGKEAIPFIKKSIDECISAEKAPFQHMIAMRTIGGDEAIDELLKYAESDDPVLVKTARDVLTKPPFIKNKQFFLKLLASHDYTTDSVTACINNGWEAEALAALQKLAEKPVSFEECVTANGAIRFIKDTGKNKDNAKAHKQKYYGQAEAYEHIKILALRSGDAPGTPQIKNFNETEADAESRLAKEDLKRLKPMEDYIVKAPETEMSILTGISLCLFNVPKGAASPKYVNRVRESGMRILTRLPKKDVERMFESLGNIKNKEMLSDIKRVQIKYLAKLKEDSRFGR